LGPSEDAEKAEATASRVTLGADFLRFSLKYLQFCVKIGTPRGAMPLYAPRRERETLTGGKNKCSLTWRRDRNLVFISTKSADEEEETYCFGKSKDSSSSKQP
jgi:hypothetical protein